MTTAVLSRAWRGETPYIRSWIRYYLDFLKFDAAVVLRCDSERFDFLADEFGDRVVLVDRPASDGDEIFRSLVDFDFPREFDYVFSCDVDEFLVLHGKTVGEFVGESEWDSCFLWWAMCCSTHPCSGDLRDNLRLGVGSGHDGKTIFRADRAVSFHNEHHVNMEPGSELRFETPDFESRPYVLHMCSRGFEDLMVRSLGQLIKVDAFGDRYFSCLGKPPNDFRRLPLRFKVAYVQERMERVPFRCDLPPLPVDSGRLKSLFDQTGAMRDRGVFERRYRIDDILEGYPSVLYGVQMDFNEVVREAEALRRVRSII